MSGLVVDPSKCTACRACELACSFTHEGAFAPWLSRIRVVRIVDRGVNVPIVCVHCAWPSCVDACPTGAAHIDRELAEVRIDEDECTGCGECVNACPFGAIELNAEKGIAFVCDLCGEDPACVTNCIHGALTFGRAETVAQRKRRATAESYALGSQGA
ncbi:MAG: 4Fe-4S dicluster domain-containing protein [Anaerolineae bacterium]|nr:4Fe-4S dicluster domain-containing protein [Anaerolineae bacterium]